MVRKTVKRRNEELAQEGKKLRHYGLKLRAKPTMKQLERFQQFAGAARFAYNFYLHEKKEVYQQTGETLRYGEFKKAFNGLKEHPVFSWLKEIDKFALECGLEQVDEAFERFFAGQNHYPTFKSKHCAKQSYSTKETNGNIALDVEKQRVKLPKIGWVKVALSKKQQRTFQTEGFNGKIKSATITMHTSGQVHISLNIEEIVSMEQELESSLVFEENVIGLDLGLTHFLIRSDGVKVDNPHYFKQSLTQLARLQRKLKHKKIGSANYKKQQRKIAKLYLKITNQRKDFLHQQSRQLVNENQVIVLEDLHVKGMLKNHKLARSISDVSWAMFKTFLCYKADWANKKIILIDRFYPSSKVCNTCREKNPFLSLSERTWICSNCGTACDRDVNAAKNIKEEGLRRLKEAL